MVLGSVITIGVFAPMKVIHGQFGEFLFNGVYFMADRTMLKFQGSYLQCHLMLDWGMGGKGGVSDSAPNSQGVWRPY